MKCLPIIAAHPIFCAEPQMPLAILQHEPHPVASQAVLGGEGVKCLPIIAAHPIFCAEPQIASAVLEDGVYDRGGQTVHYIERMPRALMQASSCLNGLPRASLYDLTRSGRSGIQPEMPAQQGLFGVGGLPGFPYPV